ncbi:B3 domain-containing protein At5g42700 isoform X2 [Prosopis cineraria]|uniref:B3 domain-containing protein At5g42700 isoform X2 n=1 Tax=Prosopis cineraria TaxID=364024 RepID=UPI002410087E|nr:B3 domain-containing protein At5g42700 isoform X2 [Prosopis cineraria]XP_054799116.1 B3 domain-containing protein At5g42700 isoform X2 [Prosopis cineraria]
MVVPKLSYEESRRKRLEENQKRIEALNLPQLSQALRNSPSPKSSPMKHTKSRSTQKQIVVVRRSGRVANMPAPVYKEVVIDRVAIPRRVYGTKRNLSNCVLASEEAREEAFGRAEKLLPDLESEYPTFIKSMLPSHVSGGFWLGLSVQFCKTYLPKRDEMITLIDGDGDEYSTVYLARKTGLSGGWKGFAVAHNLADGDALVFQLIRPTAFKVHIIRVKSPTPTEGN